MMLPREHGAWAMLIMPLILGSLLSGFTVGHALLFLGTVSLYLSIYPLTRIVKGERKNGDLYYRWFFIYLVFSIFFVVPLVWTHPWLMTLGIVLLPVVAVNIVNAKRNNERSLLNDFVAIIGMSIGGVAGVYINSAHEPNFQLMLYVWLLSVIYFMTSTFHVKTLIREKGNTKFKFISRMYHAVIIIFTALTLPYHWFLAFIPAIIKGLLPSKPQRPLVIGLVELAHAMIFVILIVYLYYR
ncbi:hypothetical protein BHU72_10530 [Desulfuribacillus stibiiarsenatis]|uniref:YwiC-like protein n=1 Tax=Desulfuribacillus stibiiarsenatis TaxID=1390249 RepID=A0A1E5L9H2_9FIRM|nr:YwiC-like family protein [Desulfuribacillus stibiiarsenatis]OEH86674.1 hypothetical protein BHU72_10530 [Desulfuribacillus stibiiarsenatis]